MKIVFVTPPMSQEERYGRLAGAGSTMPSLGLLSLATAVRRNGFETSIIEAGCRNLNLEETVELIDGMSPSFVGLTAATVSIHNAAALAKAIKRRAEDIQTVIGGAHVTALPREVMSCFPQFDVGVIGEGDETIVELMQTASTGGDFGSIDGLALRENQAVHLTGGRKLISDLDRLPFPAWDLLQGFPNGYHPPGFRFKRLPAASVVTSRGCPSHCLFCDRSVFGNRHRTFSSDYVVEMIETLNREHGVREILFEDDTFLLHEKRVRAICEQLIRKRLDISWSCLGRAGGDDPATLALMKRAGCWQISYGIESGAQEILDLVQKGTKLEDVEETVRLTREAGLKSKGFFMLGHPGETEDSMRRTTDFAVRVGVDDISVSKFTPFPGTEIYETARQFGDFDDDWRKMNLIETVFVPKGLTKEGIDRQARIILRRFYLRPRILLAYLARVIRYPRTAPRILKGFAVLLKSEVLR